MECQLGNVSASLKVQYGQPCRSEMQQNWRCPSLLLVNQTTPSSVFDELCGVKNSSILYNVECSEDSTACLDSIYDHPIYPYDNPKFDQLIKDFNANYSSRFNFTMDKPYFEDKATNSKKIKKILEHHRNVSTTQYLPLPPVDTIVMYSDLISTQSRYIINPNSNKTEPEAYYHKAGDGTVSNWGSLLVGMKWLYDKKVDD